MSIWNSKIRIVGVVIGTILLMALMAGWQLADSISNEQKEQLKTLTENQVSFARHSLQIQIESLVKELVDQVDREKSGLVRSTETFRQREKLGEFLALAWLGDSKSLSWLMATPETATRINLEVVERQMASLPLLLVKDRSAIWVRLTENNGQPVFAMMIEIQTPEGSPGIAVGFLSPQIFADLGGFYKSQDSEFMVVDDKGYAFAYTSPQYVGAQMLNHPAVAHLFEQSSVATSGETNNLVGDRAVFASERLSESNLFVMLINPVNSIRYLLSEYALRLGAIAALIALLGGMLVSYLLYRQGKGLGWLKMAIRQMAMGQSFLLPGKNIPDLADIREELMKLSGSDRESFHASEEFSAKPNKEAAHEKSSEGSRKKRVGEVSIGGGELHGENKEGELSLMSSAPGLFGETLAIPEEVGRGVVESLRPALAAILGHAQLARSKSGEDDQLKQHFSIIEQESRRLRGILEKIENLVRPHQLDLVNVDFREVLMAVLSGVNGELAAKGIQLTKALHENGTVNLDLKSFRWVIEELIHNAMVAMEGLGKREIEVSTQIHGEKIILSIKDSGKGMSEEERGKAFKPFYTTQDHGENSGLGLSQAKQLISSMHGSISIDSELGKGTTIKMGWPLARQEKRRRSDQQVINQVSSPQRELEESTSSERDEEKVSPQLEVLQDSVDVVAKVADSLGGLSPLTRAEAHFLPQIPVGLNEQSSSVEKVWPGKDESDPEMDEDMVMALEGENSEVDGVNGSSGGFTSVDLSRKTSEVLLDDIVAMDLQDEEAASDEEIVVKIRTPKVKV